MMTCYLNSPDGLSYTKDLIRMFIQPEDVAHPIIANALRDVEHVYKIEGLAFYSSDFGVKSPESLSNGIRTLILLKCFSKHGELLNSSNMGANVAPFVGELSNICDFDFNLNYFLDIPDDCTICVKDAATGKVLKTGKEFKDFYSGRYYD